MNKHLFLTILLILSFSVACHDNRGMNDKSPESNDSHHFPKTYTSIDGMWRCTEETANRFPHGVLEFILMVSGGQTDHISARACFLWEGRYYDEWHLSGYSYNDSTGEITLTGMDGDKYRGCVDKNYEKITGTVFPNDPEDEEDNLDFIREKELGPGDLFYPRKPAPDGSIGYSYHIPEQSPDGIPTGSVFEYIHDTAAFNDLMVRIIRQQYGHLESLLILKDEKLIVEEYFYNYEKNTLHDIYSCTKSITSLLLGIALDQHPSFSVDQPFFDFFPDYDSLIREDNQGITLKHLLTMHSGLGESEGVEESDFDSRLLYLLNLPVESPPGEKFRYCNDCSNMLCEVIHAITGKPADVFAEEELFGPMGITVYNWEKENGIPFCNSGFEMLPRDEIKIGWLVLNNGIWEGEQIVSTDWIEESTRAHVKETKFFDYAYHWWHRSNANVPWWRETEDLIEGELEKVIAMGYGGQYIFIIRDLNMVIVTTASDLADGRIARSKVPMVVEDIVPLFTMDQ